MEMENPNWPPTPEQLRTKCLGEIADVVYRDHRKQGKQIYFAAAAHLSAMQSLRDVRDNYGADSGQSIIAYFLCNAAQWRGPVARIVKAELKRRIK